MNIRKLPTAPRRQARLLRSGHADFNLLLFRLRACIERATRTVDSRKMLDDDCDVYADCFAIVRPQGGFRGKT